jgi:hypothetical protein
VLAVLSWKSGTNLLSIPTSPARNDLTSDSAELERIRKANLDIARTLPNFAASERASRFVRRKGGSALQLQDTVDSELIYQGVHATRQNVRINGKPTPKNGSSYWLPGINWWIGWEIGFGSELTPLFDRKYANRFSYEGPENRVAGSSSLTRSRGCLETLHDIVRIRANASSPHPEGS